MIRVHGRSSRCAVARIVNAEQDGRRPLLTRRDVKRQLTGCLKRTLGLSHADAKLRAATYVARVEAELREEATLLTAAA